MRMRMRRKMRMRTVISEKRGGIAIVCRAKSLFTNSNKIVFQYYMNSSPNMTYTVPSNAIIAINI
jgi:hypothetical protein